MQHVCGNCDRLLNEGDKVTVNVTSTYHILKSTVAYALDKQSMTADSGSLRHHCCQFPKGEPTSD